MSSNKLLKKVKYEMKFIPDKMYLQIYYFLRFKKFINFKNPKTYNEKLNWLKLNDRNPLYTTLVDKYEAKEYVSKLIGKEYIIPSLGVWDSFDEIDFNKLPNKFVLKCTHDSEGLVIVKDKSKLNKIEAKKKIETAMKYNFYYIAREWPYKNVKPRIIAEEYMEDKKYHELRDYKFFCFDGQPKALYIATNRSKGEPYFDYYNLDFKHLDIKQKYQNSPQKVDKPINFKKMIELSQKLSKDLKHARIDFYEVDGKIYFGEITFYHFSGFMPFQPNKWDKIFGDWLDVNNQNER